MFDNSVCGSGTTWSSATMALFISLRYINQLALSELGLHTGKIGVFHGLLVPLAPWLLTALESLALFCQLPPDIQYLFFLAAQYTLCHFPQHTFTLTFSAIVLFTKLDSIFMYVLSLNVISLGHEDWIHSISFACSAVFNIGLKSHSSYLLDIVSDTWPISCFTIILFSFVLTWSAIMKSLGGGVGKC